MKIYTNEASQFGKSLLILNKEVSFDSTGCAEVEPELGKALIEYSKWYQDSRPKAPVKEKALTIEESLIESQNVALRSEIEKLQKVNESRQSKLKSKETELDAVREDMQKVVDERDAALARMKEVEENFKKEAESSNYRFELALMDMEELKGTCEALGIKETKYKKLDKRSIIELVVQAQ